MGLRLVRSLGARSNRPAPRPSGPIEPHPDPTLLLARPRTPSSSHPVHPLGRNHPLGPRQLPRRDDVPSLHSIGLVAVARHPGLPLDGAVLSVAPRLAAPGATLEAIGAAARAAPATALRTTLCAAAIGSLREWRASQQTSAERLVRERCAERHVQSEVRARGHLPPPPPACRAAPRLPRSPKLPAQPPVCHTYASSGLRIAPAL